jgi:septal ring factor EnvC (AmiA/AmiB activator)
MAMAEGASGAETGGSKATVSAVGGFLIGLVLGAGILLVYHSRSAAILTNENDGLRRDIEILQRSKTEYSDLSRRLQEQIDDLQKRVKELEAKAGIVPKG